MVRHVVSPHVYLLSQSLLSCIKRTRDAQGRSNVLRPLQRRFKARKKPEGYTSTPTGLKRLKTQNTAFHVNANGKGTPSGVPQPIHKRKLILVKEEFDASSFGGGAENRTPVHTTFSMRLYKLSPWSGFGCGRPADKRDAPEPVRSLPEPYRLRAQAHSPRLMPDRGAGKSQGRQPGAIKQPWRAPERSECCSCQLN